MILTESGVCFANQGAHWRCIKYPDLVMLPSAERCRVGEREFATLSGALAWCRDRAAHSPVGSHPEPAAGRL